MKSALILFSLLSVEVFASQNVQQTLFEKLGAEKPVERIIALNCGGKVELEVTKKWKAEGDLWFSYYDGMDFMRKLREQASKVSPFAASAMLGMEPGEISDNDVRIMPGGGAFDIRSFGITEEIGGCKAMLLAVPGYQYTGRAEDILLNGDIYRKLSTADQYVARLALNNMNMELVRTIFDSNNLKLPLKERYKLYLSRRVPTLFTGVVELVVDSKLTTMRNGEPLIGVDLRMDGRYFYLTRTTFYPGGRVREISYALPDDFYSYELSRSGFDDLQLFKNSGTPSETDKINCPVNVSYRANGSLLQCGNTFFNAVGEASPVTAGGDTIALYTGPAPKEYNSYVFANKLPLILAHDVSGKSIVIASAPKTIVNIKVLESDGCGGPPNAGITYTSRRNPKHGYDIEIKLPAYCTAVAEITWGDSSPRPRPRP